MIKAVFIREVKYPTWVANIVPVIKKYGQIRICADFCELLVDATTEFNALSFIDGFSGYNQIKRALEDEEFITF